MGLFRHAFRTLYKPYYVAVAETTSDYVYKIVPKLSSSANDSAAFQRAMLGLDIAWTSFSKRDPITLRLAAEHWATRVASPASVRAVTTLFGDPTTFMKMFSPFITKFPNCGHGLLAFQQALKDAGVIAAGTLREELSARPTL